MPDVEVRILIMDPLSESARLRGRSLGNNPIEEVNEAVRKVRSVLGEVSGNATVSQRETISFSDNNRRADYLTQQLVELQKAKSGYDLEIRFYNTVTDAPYYIIGNSPGSSSAKGFLTQSGTATSGAWLVFVNSVKEDDVFDILMNNFESIWSNHDLSYEFPRGDNEYDVFISHASADADIVQRIDERLRDHHVKTFLDQDQIEPGEFFPDRIRHGLLKSRALAFVATEASLKSEWVKVELNSAWVLGKPVVPILNGVSIDALPSFLRNKQIKAVQYDEFFMDENPGDIFKRAGSE